LTKVSERRIQTWVDGQTGSARSIHHRRAVLRNALNRAVRQRLLAHNPAEGKRLEMPNPAWHGQRPLTFEEGKALLASSRESRWHPLWRTGLYTGLRIGELLGLTWEDFDRDAGTLTVVGQMQRLGHQWVRSRTKSARGVERIAIDPRTVEVLVAHERRMAVERRPDWRYFGHLFIDADGEPHHQADVLRAFHAACDEAGIPRRRFHDLRATHQTLLKDLGIEEDVRMARAGHETKEMARHYGRASETQDRAAVMALAEALG
jgi:integrase